MYSSTQIVWLALHNFVSLSTASDMSNNRVGGMPQQLDNALSERKESVNVLRTVLALKP